jgi:hypothetical protein
MSDDDPVLHVEAEPVTPERPDRFAHLLVHRGLIVRRALLTGAIRGFLPVPVVDEQLAVRVRAGLLGKLALGRQVDLPPASASVLAGEEAVAGNLTFAAAAALVAKFAGRKFLALLAAGRGAEQMAKTFERATLFDHYCVKMHVGGAISRADADALRKLIDGVLAASPGGPVLAAFREGSRVLGRSLLEAPRWLAQRIKSLAERFAHSGGNPDIIDAVPEPEGADGTWLERASQVVEDALARAGNTHLAAMLDGFERSWKDWQAGKDRSAGEDARAD